MWVDVRWKILLPFAATGRSKSLSAGGGVYGATGCTASLAEGSFAGLTSLTSFAPRQIKRAHLHSVWRRLFRKCAWSGCSSAPISFKIHRAIARFRFYRTIGHLVLFLPYFILARSSAPSIPLLTYFYPRSTLKLTCGQFQVGQGQVSRLTFGRVCSRSAMFKQAWHCSRSIADFKFQVPTPLLHRRTHYEGTTKVLFFSPMLR